VTLLFRRVCHGHRDPCPTTALHEAVRRGSRRALPHALGIQEEGESMACLPRDWQGQEAGLWSQGNTSSTWQI